MAIKNIHRQGISEQVLEQMRDMIVSGEWTPGSKIPSENELAEAMGISRVSIRSAIQKLSSQGLLESRHGEGTFVCTLDGSQCFNSLIPAIALSSSERESLHEFRTIIECESVRLAVERATPEQIAFLKSTVEEMAQFSDEPGKAADADMRFHMGIASITGNPYLVQVFEILKDNFISNLVENVHTMGASSGITYHSKICDAFEAGDPELAKSLMADHLRITDETMKRLKNQ